MMRFGEKQYLASKIKYYRKESNLTQAQLVEMSDLSVQFVSCIERGCYIHFLKTFFMV